MTNPNVKIWKDMLKAGIPIPHIRRLAENHLVSLQELLHTVKEKQQAISDVKSFIDSLSENQQE